MWRLIRNRQPAGYRFRRQTPIGQYIVDLVCFEKKLVVEIDGDIIKGSPITIMNAQAGWNPEDFEC